MSIRVAINHRIEYRFDRLIALASHAGRASSLGTADL